MWFLDKTKPKSCFREPLVFGLVRDTYEIIATMLVMSQGRESPSSLDASP